MIELGRRHPARALLAFGVLASGVVLLAMTWDVIFLRDEWAFVLYRRGFTVDTMLEPHAGHLHVAVIAIYKALLAAFGMERSWPFHLASTLVFLTGCVALFVWMSRRVGEWLALFGALLILFFGAGYNDLLSPFQMVFTGSVAAGIGMLLALDREDRAGDLLACALLGVSILFSEIGVAFAAGAAVQVALGERPWRRRLFIPLIPVALYGLWYVSFPSDEPSRITLHNLANLPRFILDSAAAAVGGLSGLASASDHLPHPVGQQWGPVLLAVLGVLAAARIARARSVPRGVWTVLAIGLAFWALAGLNYLPEFREPGNGRYIYQGAVFVLLIAAAVLEGVKPGRRVVLGAAAATALALVGSIGFLSDGYRYYIRNSEEQQRGAITAFERTLPLNPHFVLNATTSPVTFYDISGPAYASAVEDFGSPAYSEDELRAAPDGARQEADRVFAAMLGIALRPSGSGGRPRGGCSSLRASETGGPVMPLPPGARLTLSGARRPVTVALGRYADGFPADAGTLGPGETASLTIPRDDSPQPWRLGLLGEGPVTVCVRA